MDIYINEKVNQKQVIRFGKINQRVPWSFEVKKNYQIL